VAGQILFEGVDLLTLKEAQMRELRGRRIGMVFQEPMTALNPVMRIGEQIGEVFDAHSACPRPRSAGASSRRCRCRPARPRADHRQLPVPPLGGSAPARDDRVRAGARAVLLICDEPTTALDVTTQAQILKLIRELQQRRGTAVLFITHDFGVVSEIADHVVVMQTGHIVEAGPVRRVLDAPQHPYTRKLIDAIPDGQAQRATPADELMRVLQVQDLCKTYRSGNGLFKRGRSVQAAKDISFELKRGETLGLVGESGSGKSSVGRCLVGLAPFDSGRILFKGRHLSRGAAFRREAAGKIQMVFQDPYASLNPRHKIGAAIADGPIVQGVSKTEAMARALELLKLVGLGADAAQRYPHEFSGGQRQRIAIARALAMQPELLVADEPVSALDVSVQAQVLELFAQVRAQFQLAMVFITHDLRVAGQMCDHIAVMQRGEVVEYGETHEVLGNPQHAYTRKLIAAVPRLTQQPHQPTMAVA
jgi:peptide/nickel transport system ATP-binding protein